MGRRAGRSDRAGQGGRRRRHRLVLPLLVGRTRGPAGDQGDRLDGRDRALARCVAACGESDPARKANPAAGQRFQRVTGQSFPTTHELSVTACSRMAGVYSGAQIRTEARFRPARLHCRLPSHQRLRSPSVVALPRGHYANRTYRKQSDDYSLLTGHRGSRPKNATDIGAATKVLLVGAKMFADGCGRWMAIPASLTVAAAMMYAQSTESPVRGPVPSAAPISTDSAPAG